jgi:transcriptional regulator GlxA family with amidase domain
MTISVGIFIFDEVEVLDFAGPYEVFTTASRVFRRIDASRPVPFKIFTIARNENSVRTRPGLIVQADYTISNHPAIDLLIVPGGIVTAEIATSTVPEWIASLSQRTKLIASVCTGAFLLAKAGLLDGKSATTHWEDIADMQAMFPSVKVMEGSRWVDEGTVVTSAGISAGIDMSLYLVERFAGRELSLRTARQMDYHRHEDSEAMLL